MQVPTKKHRNTDEPIRDADVRNGGQGWWGGGGEANGDSEIDMCVK